jgi:hypothetical protein
MKFILLLLLLFSAPAAVGQQVVEPARVSVRPMDGDDYDARLVREVKAELRSRRVGIVEMNADVVVVLMAAPIEGMSCTGYAATMFAGSGRDKNSDRASMHTAPDMMMLASHIAEKLEREFFRRRAAPK